MLLTHEFVYRFGSLIHQEFLVEHTHCWEVFRKELGVSCILSYFLETKQ